MTPAAGQALRWCQRLIRLALAVGLLGGLAAAALLWRLGQGPLPVPMLARQIEHRVNRDGGLRLEIGSAALAWEGWRAGGAAPLDIRLKAVRLLDAEGALRADLPDAALTFSARALLQGRLGLATVELPRPSLLVTRDVDGSISLGPGMAAGEAEAERSATPLAAMVGALHRSAGAGGTPLLASFRRLRIQGGSILVVDRQIGQRWMLAGMAVELRRGRNGEVAAEGSATAESAGIELPVRISASMPAGVPPRLTAALQLPVLRPGELATLWPDLAPLRVLDAPVALTAVATIDAAGDPPQLQARLASGAGALDFGHGRRLPFAGLDATLEGDGGLLSLTGATLRLPGALDGTAPALHARGEARRVGEGWTAGVAFDLPALGLDTLPALWPAGLAEGVRGPALAALAEGRLQDLHLGLSVRAGAEFAEPRLVEAKAGFVLEQAVIGLGAAAAAAGKSGTLPPGSRLVAERIAGTARLTPDALHLDRLELRLRPPGADAPASTLLLHGAATRTDDVWQGAAELGLDALRFADLPQLWPEGVRADEREWITRNVTAGTLRNGQWRIEGRMASDGAPDIQALRGTAAVADATVYWLRPVPPIQVPAATATFSLDEIVLRAQGGRQLVAPAVTGRAARAAAARGIESQLASIRFLDLRRSPSRAEIEVRLTGGLPDVMTLLRHPRLKLFERRPLTVGALAGRAEARLQVGFPLLHDLPMEALRVEASGKVADARLTDVLMGHELERGAFDFAVDTDGLKLNGQGVMVDAPLRVTLEMDFRPGPQAQVTERAQLTVPRADARQLNAFGLDTAGLMEGTAAVEARYERRRNGQGSVALRGDLREASLAFEPAGWAKPVGAPGSAEATLRLTGDQLTAADGLRIDTAGLLASGRILFAPGNRMERVEIASGSRLGATRFGGEITRPRREGGPWAVTLRGPVADLQPILGGPPGETASETPPRVDSVAPAGPQFVLDFRFERGTMGEGRSLFDLGFRAAVDGRGLLRSGEATGYTGARQAGPFALTLAPRGAERHLILTAMDGGALLRALDLTDVIAGGRLSVNGVYRELRPGAPLSGTAELDQFVVRNAPGLGKLLQAMTLYGLVEAMQGGNGLVFSRLIAPFTLTREALTLNDARAFSASLGLTAKGRFLRRERRLDIEGTVVPAYFFNQLLGNIPILGRLFSPERGGGVFAATYRLRGPSADPSVSVNPLAALTPGFLRGLFGLAEGGRGTPVPNPTDRR